MFVTAERNMVNPVVFEPMMRVVPNHELGEEEYQRNRLVNTVFELSEGLTFSQQGEVVKIAGRAIVGEIVDIFVTNSIHNGVRVRTVYQVPKVVKEKELTPFFYADLMMFRNQDGKLVNELGVPVISGPGQVGHEVGRKLLTAEMVVFELSG